MAAKVMESAPWDKKLKSLVSSWNRKGQILNKNSRSKFEQKI